MSRRLFSEIAEVLQEGADYQSGFTMNHDAYREAVMLRRMAGKARAIAADYPEVTE